MGAILFHRPAGLPPKLGTARGTHFFPTGWWAGLAVLLISYGLLVALVILLD